MNRKERAAPEAKHNICLSCKKENIVVIPKAKFIKYLQLGNQILTESVCIPPSLSKYIK